MRFHVQLLNPYPPGIIKTKHWRFNVQYLNPHPPHVMSCDQRPTPGGWHVAWCGKEIGPQHPKIETEAAIFASKRFESRYNYTWSRSGIIVPGGWPRVGPGPGNSKPKQPFLLRSASNRFESLLAASVSSLQLPPLPGLAQALKIRNRSSHFCFESLRIASCCMSGIIIPDPGIIIPDMHSGKLNTGEESPDTPSC